MKNEVENYIKAKMKRALAHWERARENYEKGNMKDAANWYAVAMQLYYECASDLIDGTGFKDNKGGDE
jgi:hypothetical protein